jgi:hypothetical protein
MQHDTAGEQLPRGPGPGIWRAAGPDRGEESYLPSCKTDTSVIFSSPVPLVVCPHSPGLKTDADVIFQNFTGPV